MTAFTDITALAETVQDGALIAIPPDYSGCAMAAVRELIRRNVRGLRLVGVPSGGFQADMLVGAGCVDGVEAAAMTLGEYGSPPRFVAAFKAGAVRMADATCPAIHAGLQAAEKGVPFLPLRGLIGSDILAHRPDWKLIDNPFADDGDKIVALPAIRPDVALFHAAKADRSGNVWIGVRRELMLMAHAAKATLVTVEEIVEEDLLEDPVVAAGTIPGLYITAIAEAAGGARPVGLPGCYPPDHEELAEYARQAKSEEGFRDWLETHVHGRSSAA
jgi:glutaconate CoA-transferase subunit A